MLFLPQDPALRLRYEEQLTAAVGKEELRVLGWRDVPADNRCLGEIARSAEPVVRQVFVSATAWKARNWSGRLFLAARRAERARDELLGLRASLLCPSMSSRTICYKGMFLAPQLFAYYPRPGRPADQDGAAVVHQRYSTNTFPSWRLAQPFRMIAHTVRSNHCGEMPTVAGVRELDGLPGAGQGPFGLYPILQPGGSDSACFDNCMELLVRAGRAAPHALMMMIPRPSAPATTYPPTSDRSTSITQPSWSPGTDRRP